MGRTDNDKILFEYQHAIKHTHLCRYIRMGAIKILLRLQEQNAFPKKPKVLKEKKMTAKQLNDLWIGTIIEKCIHDNAFMESFLLGEELVPFWSTETVGKKQYHSLDLVPKHLTKNIIVKIKETEEGGEQP